MGGRPSVVVIGGGIAGLAAAQSLHGAGSDAVVLERETEVGGRILTVAVDEAAVDVGAQFVPPFYGGVLAAARDAGLDGAWRDVRQDAAIVHDGRTWPIGGVPTIARSRLLPTGSRARLATLALPLARAARHLDPDDITAASGLDDGSADEFARRWAGDMATDRVLAPLVRGLGYWELGSMSRAMLMIMLRVSLASRRVRRMDGGLSRFPASLALPLTVHRGATAERIERRGRAWRVHVAGGGFVDGDGVVCATTASVARRLRPELPWPSHPITYTSSITVTVRVAVAPPPTALLPASGDETSVASINPVVEGGRPTRLVRICSSGGAARRLLDTDDEEAAAVLLTAASGIVPWCDGAHVVHLRRWTEALPNFPVGAIRAIERRGWLGDDRLAMAGDYLGGPSLEGAFRSGRSAALRVLDQLL